MIYFTSFLFSLLIKQSIDNFNTIIAMYWDYKFVHIGWQSIPSYNYFITNLWLLVDIYT